MDTLANRQCSRVPFKGRDVQDWAAEDGIEWRCYAHAARKHQGWQKGIMESENIRLNY